MLIERPLPQSEEEMKHIKDVGLYQKIDKNTTRAILDASQRVNQVPNYKQDFAYKLIKLKDLDSSLWDLNS